MGAPKQRPLTDRHTHTRRGYDLENPKDYRLLSKLLKNPTSKDNLSYMYDSFLGMGFSGGKDGLHGITCLAWRIAVGAASQIHRDSNHGKTKKNEPLGGLNAAMLVSPNHGGFETLSWGF